MTVESWAEVRRLHRAEGMSIKAIGRRLGVARNTVRAALAAHEPPMYERERAGSRVDGFEPAIRGLLAEFPDMPATVIADRIGWVHSSSVLRARVAQLRPLFRPADPADRTTYAPGEIVQCDLWFPGRVVPVGTVMADPPVGTMVAAYSGFIMAVLLPSDDRGPSRWDVGAAERAGWGAEDAGLGQRVRDRGAPPSHVGSEVVRGDVGDSDLPGCPA